MLLKDAQYPMRQRRPIRKGAPFLFGAKKHQELNFDDLARSH